MVARTILFSKLSSLTDLPVGKTLKIPSDSKTCYLGFNFQITFKFTFNALLDVLSSLLEKWSEAKIAQPVALQLLFDCRYVAAATGSLVDQKFQNIQQDLEQLVSQIIIRFLENFRNFFFELLNAL